MYEAEHCRLSTRAAALKVVRLERSTPDFAKRFDAEAALLASLDHPNVVRLFDAGVTDDGLAWMAMELLTGRTLDQILDEQGTLSIEDALHILAEIADGLHAAHLLEVVHRDLKPSNVFITDRQLVKVLDFGNFKAFGDRKTLKRLRPSTEHNVLIGTFAFMAPEQLIKKPPPDHRADIFALGVMGYLMLSGRHPFAGEDESGDAMVLAHGALMMEPPSIRQFVPGCPEDVAAIVASMLAKDREHRPRTMARLATLLREARERFLRN